MTDPVIEQIKERLSIVDVVGQYVKLTKAGKNYKGLSPFKTEKTPSFFVQPDKGMYYDFSTNQGGDIFTFVQAMDGLDFQGALHLLAERAGVVLARDSKAQRDARTRLYDACEDACHLFETKLEESIEARAYLRSRGVEDGIRRRFRIGLANDAWQDLYDFLRQKGYTAHELEQAGLVKKGERGSYYDRFRSRIMFPIQDSASRVVAFSGRITGVAADDKENAKYLNSPETPLFDKGRILYGYDKAKSAIRKYDFAILVEGQLDLVLSHQAGFSNTVAVSGTGLTEHHVELILRLTKNLILAFDADDAGVRSSGRAAVLSLPRGMDVKVARIPFGKDPAECIAHDPETWKSAVRSAVHVVEFYLGVLESDAKNQREYGLRVRDVVLPLVKSIPSGVDRAHFVRLIANRLDMPEGAIIEDLARLHGPASPEPTRDMHADTERTPAKVPLSRAESIERTVAGLLFWQDRAEDPVLATHLIEREVARTRIELAPILARHAELREVLALETQLIYEDGRELEQEFVLLMTELARAQAREELAQITKDLKTVEAQNDNGEAERLLARFTEVSKRLEQLA